MRLKNHKAIKEATLSNLAQLNVICGKNNSGKTSILEAFMNESCFSIGRTIADDSEWAKKIFKEVAEGYTSPAPYYTIPGFNNFIDENASNNYVLYEDKIPEFHSQLNDSNSDAARISNNKVFEKLFDKSKKNFKPLLVPAKRLVQSLTTVQTDEQVQPDGTGLTNRLFHLKNQDISSPEYIIYKKILSSFEEITNHTYRIVTTGTNQIEISFKNPKSDWARADSCGMGLSDVLVIICHAIDSEFNFILIEEPESHLHPELQKNLLTFIKKIRNKQFLMSTHSSLFLNPFIADRIFFSHITDQVIISDETHKSEILQNLGYSVTDNIVSDVIVLTEGPTDIPVLMRILQLNNVLEKFNIKFWPLGGDIMAQLNLDVFAERNNVLAIIDSDPKSSPIRTRFMRNCKDKGIKCIRLKRYAIENYFSIDAIKLALKEDFPKHLKEISPEVKLDEQLGFIKNGKTTKISIKAKSAEIVKYMTLEDFKDTDLQIFVNEVIKICNIARSSTKIIS